MEMKKLTVEDLSPALFWDVDKSDLDFEKHKSFVIQRTLEYGIFEDWIKVKSFYNKEQIKEVALNFRTLDPISLSFIASYLGINKTEFRCYKHAQLHPNYWNSFID